MTLSATATREVKGLVANGVYGGVNKACVQELIDMIDQDASTQHRLYIDQMSPLAKASLLVELSALLVAIENV